ncbi:hypothetical protein NE865_00363 [Phthorimaea operculella]|nr:hypothetical protein NE865_00363 [Phthorimaea operculella]
MQYMTPYEMFSKAAGVVKSKEAMEEFRPLNGMRLDGSHCMICYEDTESDANTKKPIVGINLVTLDEGKSEFNLPEVLEQIKSPEIKKLLKIVNVIEELCDARKTLGLDKYYAGWGVCVRPDFAGFGVAQKLLSLRRALCKENGVPATGAWMTAVGSQKAAERDGWETIFEIPLDELGRLADCEIVGGPPTAKSMVAYADK